MEGSCKKEQCALWKKYKTTCPNHIMTTFAHRTTNELKIVEDCAPKRILAMLADLENRLIGLQQAEESHRNSVIDAGWKFVQLAKYIQENPNKVVLQIPEELFHA